MSESKTKLFLKKVNARLIIIAAIFMIVFILTNIYFIGEILDKSVKLTCNVFYDEISNVLSDEFTILEKTTQKISQNEIIIDILNRNKNYENITKEDLELMLNEIDVYEEIIKSVDFVENINIVSLSGNYLFTEENLYQNFDLTERTWFSKDILNKGNQTIITDIHKDINTNQYTISILSFIYSQENQPLGIVILDIFVEDLLSYIDNSFFAGKLNTYILKNNEIMYSKYGQIKQDIKENNNQYNTYEIKCQKDILKNGNYLLFMFDKFSIKHNSYIASIGKSTFNNVLIVGIIISIVLIVLVRLAFKPALKSIEKLKKLLNFLDGKDTSLDNQNEFKQLELISDSLGKSFDNKVQSLIYYDELTKLPNRKKLKLLCNELINNNSQFALIFIDLNKFKSINDIYGHSVGDKLLIKFSNIIQDALADKGVITRYSGDEFIVIYKDFKSESQLKEYYEKEILSKFNTPIYIDEDIKTLIEFSTGVSIYPKDGETFEELINKSDFMMYKNKHNDLSQNISFFNNEIYKDMMYIENIKNELKYAYEKKEFSLVYQPIYDKNKQIKKAEALLRWNSEKLGLISPDEFIKYAEETRDIIHIGYYVINQVCKNIKENNLDIDISINISPIQLIEPDFAKNVKDIVDKYGLDYKKLCFEITESVLLEDNENVHDNMKRLRKKGIQWALDDFGTGYASFNYLTNYSLDILKIDKVFLDNTYKNKFEIIRYIIEISNILNIKVIIEGVETENQFENLRKIKCDLYQGYYLSKPLSSDKFVQLVKNIK